MRTGATLLVIAAACLAPAAAGAQSLICIDPGHGGSDPGAVGVGGLEEASVNLDICLRLRDLLDADTADTSCGGSWSVIMTRDSDTAVSLSARASYANSQGADRFASVHNNAGGGTGTETYSYAEGTTGADMRCSIQGEVVAHLGTRDRGCKTANFAVLRETNMPATLTECAFVDTAADAAILDDPAQRQEIARAHLHALQQHFGIAPCDPGSTPAAPILEIDVQVDPVDGQEPDFCTAGDSETVFDLRTGQTAVFRVHIKNNGPAAAQGLQAGIWVEDPFLRIVHYDIYDNVHSATCGEEWCLNDANDRADNPPHDGPPATFILNMNAFAANETKMVELTVEAVQFSLLDADHPDVRAWVRHVDDFYEKENFDSAFTDACGCQTFNGGDLRAYFETDVHGDEVCDGVDNDCDGDIDEDACAEEGEATAEDINPDDASTDTRVDTSADAGEGRDDVPFTAVGGLESSCGCTLAR
jgi:N-acetylmuramoyl-L-alanine amidase